MKKIVVGILSILVIGSFFYVLIDEGVVKFDKKNVIVELKNNNGNILKGIYSNLLENSSHPVVQYKHVFQKLGSTIYSLSPNFIDKVFNKQLEKYENNFDKSAAKTEAMKLVSGINLSCDIGKLKAEMSLNSTDDICANKTTLTIDEIVKMVYIDKNTDVISIEMNNSLVEQLKIQSYGYIVEYDGFTYKIGGEVVE